MLSAEDFERIPYRRGPLNAKIVVVGEAPGGEEEADPQKRPFIGASGRFIEGMLQKVGIDPTKVYFTNVIKTRPDDKKIHRWIAKHKDDVALYTKLLSDELAALPNIVLIIPAGGIALKALCNRDSIEAWRGSKIPATLAGVKGKKCIPVIHPAAILRNWLQRPVTVLDFQRIAREQHFPEIKNPQRFPKIRPTFEEILEYFHFLLHSDCLISLDLETLPRPQRISSFQLAHSPIEGISVLLQHKDGRHCFSEDQELILWRELNKLLTTCGKRIIGQNILTFDLFMLTMYGMDLDKLLENVYLDTMEAFQCLNPALPRGLDFLTSVYTEEPYYKSEGKEWGTKQGEDEFLHYGCKDVMVVAEIAPQLYEELKEDGLLDFYYARYQKLAKARLQMSRRGLLVNETTRAELKKVFMRDIINEQCRLTVLTGKQINVKSSAQMKDLLYKDMKLPPQFSRSGEISCDEDAILTLAGKHPSEVFRHILNIRGMRTLYSNNIKSTHDSDGRIRCSYGFAESGRFRSFKSPLGSGSNLQNWNSTMRVLVVPDPGMVFVEGDLSQAEARVVAAAGRIHYMLEVFKHDQRTPEGDIHRHMAALVFEKPLEEITKKGPERYAAKRIVHASNYDMKALTFSKRYNKDAADNNMPLISVEQAGAYLSALHTKMPELKQNYHAWIEEQLNSTKTLVNPFGRKAMFHDRLGPDLYRSGYAWYPQSTVADITNTILMECCDAGLDLLLQVHDSVLVQCRHSEVDDVIRFMRSVNPIVNVRGIPVSIPMEFKISDVSWGHLQDYEPPLTPAA